MSKRGVAIATYNRASQLAEQIEAVKATTPAGTRIVVCDDGSTDGTPDVMRAFDDVIYVRGPNLGVGANKNRALVTLQDCEFMCILEDDLFPKEPGWFEDYERVCLATDIHHFCRVQDKEVEETLPEFTEWLKGHGYTPIYGPSPRGDLTFITALVLREVGGFSPEFRGVGFAHGDFSRRVVAVGLVPHPLHWVDVKEARDKFFQKGDTVGGRWLVPKKEIDKQLASNRAIAKKLRMSKTIYIPLEMQ